MIRKSANGYIVKSKKGKKLSKAYKTKAAAEKRLKQIEYFKHKKSRVKFKKRLS